ncbi:hypothetical protein [Kitasatospora sp. NPDC057198]|uniref:hypothetical protein n=1 Tax=Kitasatospora sp. NPDC057198 TaxID=3346046 RepID=UPI003638AA2F
MLRAEELPDLAGAANRGLGTALLRGAREGAGGDPAFGADCHTMIVDAGRRLLERAAATGTVRPDAP